LDVVNAELLLYVVQFSVPESLAWSSPWRNLADGDAGRMNPVPKGPTIQMVKRNYYHYSGSVENETEMRGDGGSTKKRISDMAGEVTPA